VEQLQAVWREAAACGVLDADVTNHTTGEVLSFRDYIIGLVNDVKTESDPEPAAQPDAGSGDVHDAEVVDDGGDTADQGGTE
jgi:hypothetical protein